MDDKPKKQVDEQLESFLYGEIGEKYTALRKLIAQRRHHQAAKDKDFQQALDSLLAVAGDEAVPELDRLLAVAILGRLASSIKKLRKEIYGKLSDTLQARLPDPLLLKEPDDRSYIAVACEQADPDWGVSYAASAIIHEKSGEQPRVAFFKALLAMLPDLSSALDALQDVAKDFVPATEDPGTSVARRLKRIMDAVAKVIGQSRKTPGEAPGKKLAELCKAAFQGVKAPGNKEALFETAEAVAAVIHETVRLRFSLATEADTYFGLKVIKHMLPVRDWENFALGSEPLQFVAEDISEALLILSRQGITDQSLVTELAVACGSAKQARRKLKQLAKTTGLADKVKRWLATGKAEAPVASAESESRQLDDDSILADLLVDCQRYQTSASLAAERILPEIEMLEPRLAEGLRRLMHNGLSLCDGIQSLARRRRLHVRGAPGDEEEYAPLEHELVGDGAGARRVRIIRPVVEQERENGIFLLSAKAWWRKFSDHP